MSNGTMTRIREIQDEIGTITASTASKHKERVRDESILKRGLEGDFGQQFLFGGVESSISRQESVSTEEVKNTVPIDWEGLLYRLIEDRGEEEGREEIKSVWGTSKLRYMVEEAIGSPIELTREEADEIIRLAYGSRPDLPPGNAVVREVREILGHSLIERIEKERE